MIKVVVFDLDGTLVDTIQDIANALNAGLQSIGFNANYSAEETKAFIGNGTHVLIAKAAAKFKLNNDQLAQLEKNYLEYYTKNCLYFSVPYQGVTDALDYLKKKKYQLAVLSNKPQKETEIVIKHFFKDQYFDLILGCQDKAKPDPSAITPILEYFKVAKDEIVLIGDSKVDYQTGINAGIKTMIVRYGFKDLINEITLKKGDFFLKSPLDIFDVL